MDSAQPTSEPTATPESDADRLVRHAAMLRELSEIGMGLARLAGARSMRGDEATPGEAARTFVRLSNAVRAIIEMEQRLAAGLAMHPVVRPMPSGRSASTSVSGDAAERDGRHDRLSAVEAGFLAAARQVTRAAVVGGRSEAGSPDTEFEAAAAAVATLRRITAETVARFAPPARDQRPTVAVGSPFWPIEPPGTGPPPW